VRFRGLRALRGAGLAALVALLAACAGDKPKPTPLADVAPKIAGRQVWSVKLDSVKFPLTMLVRNGNFIVAATDGTLLALEANSGRQLFRTNVGAPLSAGIGSDGRFYAVVTRDNTLVTFEGTKELWRAQLTSRVSTSPMVAGERVFVMGVDRAVHAFDALNGNRLWSLARPGEALTLLHSGVLTSVNNVLVAGQGARVAGIDPDKGTLRWEVPLGTPRGSNEIERLADLIGPALRLGTRICARSFQVAVGCADGETGRLLWSRSTGGINAIGGDEELIFAADASDRIVARKSDSGEIVWTSERMLFRGLSAPVAIGPAVVFGDFEGHVHFLDRKDGQPLLRLSTDGSQVVGQPVLSGKTLLVATRNGGFFAFRPE